MVEEVSSQQALQLDCRQWCTRHPGMTYGERDGLQVRIGERTELDLPGADGRRVEDFDL